MSESKDYPHFIEVLLVPGSVYRYGQMIKTEGDRKKMYSLIYVHENKILHYHLNVTLCRLDANLVSSVGVGEDEGLLGAEGLVAGLGLGGVPEHDVGDVGGDGRDVDLALGVSAQWKENIVVTSERILHREYFSKFHR